MAYKNSWTNSTPADPISVTIAPNAGDFLIGWAITDSTSGADTQPSGWTSLYRDTSTFDNAVLHVAYKVADGTETAAAFNSAGSNTMIAGVLSFDGIDTSTPLDVTPVTFTSSTGDTTTQISITPVTNGCDLVFVQGQDNGNSDYSFTFSTVSGTTGGWTTRADQNSGFFNVGAGTATQTTAGALTAQCVSTSGGRLGVLFALRPASSNVDLAATGSALALTGGTAGLFRSLISGDFFGGKFFNGGFFSAAAAGKSLDGTGTQLTLAGGTATLRADRKVTGTGTQLALSGGTATLSRGRALVGTGTALALAGGTATLRVDRKLTATGTALALAGGTAALRKDSRLTATGTQALLSGGTASLSKGFRLTATGTQLTLSGGTAALKVSRILVGSGGVLTLSGGTATLEKSGGAPSLDGTGTQLTLSGGTATLRVDRILSGEGTLLALLGGNATFDVSGVVAPSVPTLAPAGRSTKGSKKRKVLIGDRLYEVESLRDVELILKRLVREEAEPVQKAAKRRVRVVDRVSAKVDEASPVAVPMASVGVDWGPLWEQLARQDQTYANALLKVIERQEEDDIETLLLSL